MGHLPQMRHPPLVLIPGVAVLGGWLAGMVTTLEGLSGAPSPAVASLLPLVLMSHEQTHAGDQAHNGYQ